MQTLSILRLLCAFGLMTCVASAQLPSSLSNGLVGYWALNGTTADSSPFNNTGIGNDLTLTNDRFGNPNNAYWFNGASSYVDLGNQSQYNFGTNDFTLSAWVLSGPKQAENADYIIGKFSAPNPSSYGLGTHNNTVNIYSVFIDESGTFRVASSAQSLQDSSWHFVTATFQRSGNLSVYFDGVFGGDQDISMLVGSQSNSESLRIGGIDSNSLFGPQLFEGGISDVGMWNRALTSTEVSTLYQVQSVPEPSTYTLLLVSGAGAFLLVRRLRF